MQQPPFERRPGIRPRPTLGRALDQAARAAFPGTCTVLLMLLTLAPFGFSGQAVLLPAVAVASVWFWSLFRPGSMPPVLAFGLGVLLDLLGYLPLGSGALTLLLVHAVGVRFRRFLVRQGFALAWVVVVPVAAGSSALLWALSCGLLLRLHSPAPAIFQAVVTVAFYPALSAFFIRAHGSLADPARA